MNKKISTSKWVGNTQHKPYAQHIAIQLAASFWRVKGLEPTSCLSTFKTAAQGMQPQNTQHRACTPETHKTSTNRKQLLMGMSTPCIYLPNTQHRGNRQKKKKKVTGISLKEVYLHSSRVVDLQCDTHLVIDCNSPQRAEKPEDLSLLSHPSYQYLPGRSMCTHLHPSFCGSPWRDRSPYHLVLTVDDTCIQKSHRTEANKREILDRLRNTTSLPTSQLYIHAPCRGARQKYTLPSSSLEGT